MKDWFSQLQSREQWMVGVGAVFVVLALFYALVWQPLGANSLRLEKDIAADRITMKELRSVQGRITAPGGSSDRGTADKALVLLISQTVGRFNLNSALQSSQPSSNNATITVRFENAAFDALVSWMADLQTQQGLNVQSGSFSKTSVSGRVNATLTLGRL